MQHSPLASRLLDDVRSSHEALIVRTGADLPVQEGLRVVVAGIAAALCDLSDDRVLMAPVAEEWSMVEVVEHVAEHDGKYNEVTQHGVAHYVEHGLEHVLQLWKLRRDLGLSTPPKRAEAAGHGE